MIVKLSARIKGALAGKGINIGVAIENKKICLIIS